MAYRNDARTYGSVSKFFHWLIFILVVVMLILGAFMGDLDKPLKGEVYNLHKLTGLSILILMILRAIWALANPKPALPNSVPNWQKAASRLVHVLLYIAIIAMHIAGWVMSSASGHAPHLFHMNFMLPIAKNEQVADIAGKIHGLFAWIITVLICLHILAALKHYFINKDGVLQRMWPSK